MLSDLGWGDLFGEEIAQRLTYRTFKARGIGKMLDIVYGSSPYAALHDLFPALLPWQMKQTGNRYWQGDEGHEHAQTATRWMIEQLGLAHSAPDEIAAVVDQGTFDRAGLRGMLEIVYSDSPFAALSDLYAGLLPWQMAGGASVAYWKGITGRGHARAATRWMIDQMGLARAKPSEVARHVTTQIFEQHGLVGMLGHVYNDSPYAALKDVHPKLQPWQMARAPRTYGSEIHYREHASEATQWVLAQLELQNADPVIVASLIENGTLDPVYMALMLGYVYESSSNKAISDPNSRLHPHWIASEVQNKGPQEPSPRFSGPEVCNNSSAPGRYAMLHGYQPGNSRG